VEKSCDVSMMTFFGDVTAMTSLKRRHNCFFKLRFLLYQFEKPQFGQITQLQVTKIKG